MGQLANILRSSLRELAQSDARRLREIDRILKESRAIDDKIKRLKWFTGPSSRGVFFLGVLLFNLDFAIFANRVFFSPMFVAPQGFSKWLCQSWWTCLLYYWIRAGGWITTNYVPCLHFVAAKFITFSLTMRGRLLTPQTSGSPTLVITFYIRLEPFSFRGCLFYIHQEFPSYIHQIRNQLEDLKRF